MKTIEVNATFRKELGKKATKALRREAAIPCVMYGGKETVHFSAPLSILRHIIYTPNVYIVELNIEGKSYKATMQDIQFHPVSDAVLHIDFLQIPDNKEIIISIPVRLNGLPEGVQAGGKLQQLIRKLKVKALIEHLPDDFRIDVTEVKLGNTIKVSELSFENIELLDPKDNVVASVKLTRAARGAADEEGEEGEEGTEEGAETTEAEETKSK